MSASENVPDQASREDLLQVRSFGLNFYVPRTVNDKYSHPGQAEKQPWGLREISLADPFGIHLTLYSE